VYKFKTGGLLALSLTTAISLAANAAAEPESRPSFGGDIIDAADSNDISQVANLITSGANPNESGEFGATPLMRAVHNNNLPLVKLLLKSGANTNKSDIGGATAVSIAARESHNEILGLLIKSGAEVNTHDGEGFTPLMRAALAGNQTAVQALLSAGAKVNQANSFGETALSQAKKDGNAQIASLLTQNGADDSLAQMPQIAQIKPELVKTKAGKALHKHDIVQTAQNDDDKADIVIDFSDGKLSGRTNNGVQEVRQIASIKPEYSAASYYVPVKTPAPVADDSEDRIQIPVKPKPLAALVKMEMPQSVPGMVRVDSKWLSSLRQVAQIAARPYQIASNEMVFADTENKIIELGNFKSAEFANKKIASLKKNFPAVFDKLALHTVEKTGGGHKYFQINAGLVSNDAADDLCRQLVASGINCRPVRTDLKSQDEFNNYTSDAPVKNPPAAAAAEVSDNKAKNDLLGPTPSPEVEAKPLGAQQTASNIGSFVKPDAAAYNNLPSAAGGNADAPPPAPADSAVPAPLKTIAAVDAAPPTPPPAAPVAAAPTPAPAAPVIEVKPAEPEAAAVPAVTASDNTEAAPVKKIVKKKAKPAQKIPAPGVGAPPRDLMTGQPLVQGSLQSSGSKFDVARPVKAEGAVVTSSLDKTGSVWIKVDYFQNEAAAHNFWSNLRAQNPDFGSYSMNASTPLTRSNRTTAKIGPFASAAETQSACAVIMQSGLHCAISNAVPERLINTLPSLNTYIDSPVAGSGENKGGWIVQLGSYDSYQDAEEKWDAYAKENHHLSKLENNIIPADGRFRLRAGNFDSSAKADSLCDELRGNGISCIIVKTN